jgi:cellobiose dehydrogenase (acceptor)
MDGKLYRQEGFEVLAAGLKQAGWKLVEGNKSPDQKNRTYGHTTFMFSGGERGGPLATYLVSASQRNNFALWTNTAVKRVIREGGHATGVEVECTANGGRAGIVQLSARGRVVISSGTFGSAKLLMRSEYYYFA